MLLFILEFIGTPELILIGIVALIFLGPRKLPQIAKKMGKVMADFRNTTNEFKSTWEREVDFEEEVSALRTGDLPEPVPRLDPVRESTNSIAPPDIRPVQTDLFSGVHAEAVAENESAVNPESEADPKTTDEELSDKRNWL